MNYEEEQASEIEALLSIYEGELNVLSETPHYSFTIPINVVVEEDHSFDANVVLKFTYTPKYPDEPPSIEVDDFECQDEDLPGDLVTFLSKESESQIGTVMIFTLISEAMEWTGERCEGDRKRQIEEMQAEKEKESEEEKKKLEGTRVTIESFMSWKKDFDEEMAQARTKNNKMNQPDLKGKVTGKQLFMQDASLNDSDINFRDSETMNVVFRRIQRCVGVISSHKQPQSINGGSISGQRYVSTCSILLNNPNKFSRVKARGNTLQESESVSIDDYYASKMREGVEKEEEADSVPQLSKFKQFPDEETLKQEFDGIRFPNLHTVIIKCPRNNTKFTIVNSRRRKVGYVSPSCVGFKNASKRTNVAAQVAGVSCGQALRNMKVKNVRVELAEFNVSRLSAMKGIISAGINIVSITDRTPIDWTWRVRPQKRPRVN